MEQKPLRILVVEDHQDTREFIVLFLADSGHWVESAPDGGTALARMRQDGFDVLLTDVSLPDMEAWDLLGELRLHGCLPPRVVTMSAMNGEKGRALSLAAGCHAHLLKPFKASEIEAAIR